MDPNQQPPWASGNANFNLEYYTNYHEQQDVFQGSTSNVLPYSIEDAENVNSTRWRRHPRNITLIYFKTQSERQSYIDWAKEVGQSAYRPDLVFENNGLYGIGKPAGKSLMNWINENREQLYELNDQGNYFRVGSVYRQFGRWFGGALYAVHAAGHFIGDLPHSTFVDDKAKRVTFLRRHLSRYQNTSVEDGIKDDLNQFVNIVNLVQAFNGNNPTADVLLFQDLNQEILNQGNGQLPNTALELQSISYFLCHAPLFWDFEQRLSFYNTYWSLRQNDENDFDDHMPFNLGTSTQIDDNWSQQLVNIHYAINVMYYNAKIHTFRPGSWGTQMRHLLIPFHRNCILHLVRAHMNMAPHSLTPMEADAELYRVFPDAIPKGYIEFFKTQKFQTGFKYECLKSGTPGLDYSKSIKRRV